MPKTVKLFTYKEFLKASELLERNEAERSIREWLKMREELISAGWGNDNVMDIVERNIRYYERFIK